MIVKNMGSALRFCIPQMIGQKMGNFWELMKPLVDFKYEVTFAKSYLAVADNLYEGYRNPDEQHV